jgi:hypothetical protein
MTMLEKVAENSKKNKLKKRKSKRRELNAD